MRLFYFLPLLMSRLLVPLNFRIKEGDFIPIWGKFYDGKTRGGKLRR